MVIHQGGDEEIMPAEFTFGIPDNWLIHATPSGYMDRPGWRAVCDQFVRFSGAAADNPQYVYIDGHDSHWDSEAQDYFADNHVYINFLKSQDSIGDQPADNGPNSKLKATYGNEVADWRLRHPGVPYTPAFYNTVLASAWEKFKSDPSTTECILNAFRVTGIFPMRTPEEALGDGPNVSKKRKAEIARDAQLASVGLTDVRDLEALEEIKRKRLAEATQPVIYSSGDGAPDQVTTHERDPVSYKVAISSIANRFFNTSFVVPAAELKVVLNAQKELKGTKVRGAALILPCDLIFHTASLLPVFFPPMATTAAPVI